MSPQSYESFLPSHRLVQPLATGAMFYRGFFVSALRTPVPRERRPPCRRREDLSGRP